MEDETELIKRYFELRKKRASPGLSENEFQEMNNLRSILNSKYEKLSSK